MIITSQCQIMIQSIQRLPWCRYHGVGLVRKTCEEYISNSFLNLVLFIQDSNYILHNAA